MSQSHEFGYLFRLPESPYHLIVVTALTRVNQCRDQPQFVPWHTPIYALPQPTMSTRHRA